MSIVILSLFIVLFQINNSQEEFTCIERSTLEEQNTSLNHDVYTFNDLNNLDYSELSKVLTSVDIKNITDFHDDNQDTAIFYADQKRIDYLLNEMQCLGSQYTAKDSLGIDTIMKVVIRGVKSDDIKSDPEITYVSDYIFKNKASAALSDIISNENFTLGTEIQNEIVEHTGYIAEISSVELNYLEAAYRIIQLFNEQTPSIYIKIKSFEKAVQATINGVKASIMNNDNLIYDENISSEEVVVWYENVDKALNEIAQFLSKKIYENPDYASILDQVITFIQENGYLHTDPNFTQNTFSRSLDTYPKYSSGYLKQAEIYSDHSAIVDYKQVKAEYEQYYYGNHYSFDDGTFVIKAGNKISPVTIEWLYWAAKEVKAQFHRYYGNDIPVQIGNVDNVLTAIIYNSNMQYQMASQLNGIDTNNGGTYIEEDGIMYTWNRTMGVESLYHLEELFRHEYFHYLQSRYLIPGLWESASIYDGERLVWVEEGGAELFTGSTRTGIDPRSIMTSRIHSDPKVQLNLSDILFADYSLSPNFYIYGYVWYDYMIKKRPDIFKEVNNYLFNADEDGFDQYMMKLTSEDNLVKSYENHLNDLISTEGRVVLVSNVYTDKHTERSLDLILDEIKFEMNLTNAKSQTHKSDLFDTYTIRGTYEGSSSIDEFSDREEMNHTINHTLHRLDTQWSGYKTTTAYFVDYRVNNSRNYEYDVVFHGLLKRK
ncbi:collagenase [Chengkuizengella axinellae]|uniref:microbial collagenase n=1 Tax=Chengkuizengella axinellae TaxID=3064388 RepID=A0ABT9IUH8_9BACL|nr:collagenase [Chengkuizengella sp. 2205SS18-9]MDP5273001.1 collagenase [Chengkuizengella sp. 2205SS18-9]